MKYLIFGLGNIGSEYENTRHNIGFKVLDSLADKYDLNFAVGRLASSCSAKYKGRGLILIKPSTYMNLSGKAVQYYMAQEKVPIDRVLIVTDDLALPFGKMRLRSKGSDGGHNGLKNIIEHLGNEQFPRLKMGIGADFSRGRQIDYVLGNWSAEEEEGLPPLLDRAIGAIEAFVFQGIERTMNQFNN
ncbi:MAG TPA: aminoacyl-tRNA hydrolase [Flavobacteriales bacterium]|jgi:PTH1 family peptidyl-tRNA hydrolase|nr:aminoacyl-tRNA hydrolase [Flavobacteriales bacterium]